MTDRALRHMVLTQMPGIDGTGITVAEKAQMVNDVAEAKASADVLAALRFDPEHPNYGAVRGTGLTTAQRTANTAAIQIAANDARDTGGTLVIKGEYETDGRLTFASHVDASDGVISCYSASVVGAVLVGSLTSGVRLHNKTIELPSIIQRNKPAAPGWNASDIGLVVSNAYSCHITIPHVWNFSRGVLFTSNGTGNVYNNVYLGIMENNKVGLDIATENSTGWTNEIVWVGGRFQINSNEGTNIPGAAHIRVRNNSYLNNNHLFLKPSVEGEGPEYHLDIDGQFITVVQGRYEATPPRIRLGGNTNGISLLHGYNLHNATYTVAAGGGLNTTIQTRQHHRFLGGGGAAGVLTLSNSTGDANPAMTIIAAGSTPATDPATNYNVQIGARYTRFKAAADAFAKIEIDAATGQIKGGAGIMEPTGYLRPYSNDGHWQASKKLLAVEGIGVGNSVAASTLGTLSKKIQVFDANGNSIGYVPVYANIT